MMVKWRAIFFICLLPIVANGDFRGMVKGLGAVDFRDRKSAQEWLGRWVILNHEGAREALLSEYFETKDPEVRVRLTLLLERAYFPLKGFMGVMMAPYGGGERKIVGGKKVVKGIRVSSLTAGEAAEKAGIREGDVILNFGEWEVLGDPLTINGLLAERVQKLKPGKPVKLVLKRGKDLVEVDFELGILPTPRERIRSFESARSEGGVNYLMPNDLLKEAQGFEKWLESEINKRGKGAREG